jgi:hypothetical protein
VDSWPVMTKEQVAAELVSRIASTQMDHAAEKRA